jgi:hypothetical protein
MPDHIVVSLFLSLLWTPKAKAYAAIGHNSFIMVWGDEPVNRHKYFLGSFPQLYQNQTCNFENQNDPVRK